MANKLKSLDINETLGSITLSDGVTSIDVPRLDMSKILRIVKFIGVDGLKIYNGAREVLLNEELTRFEQLATVIEDLSEEQLIRVVAIILEVDDKEALKLDLNEVLDVLIVLADNTNLDKTFTQVRALAKKMFNVELPDFKAKMQEMFEVADEELKAEMSA
ncbi:hypothetical protein [Planococcus sp. YIM B11945]|uniref:hypothetical protein n=1 Tax=Planococcus sp. YIM B11945 TaxID=3435410 RepID=UPI003D7E240A